MLHWHSTQNFLITHTHPQHNIGHGEVWDVMDKTERSRIEKTSLLVFLQ
jgi:hypothetical protein